MHGPISSTPVHHESSYPQKQKLQNVPSRPVAPICPSRCMCKGTKTLDLNPEVHGIRTLAANLPEIKNDILIRIKLRGNLRVAEIYQTNFKNNFCKLDLGHIMGRLGKLV